MLCKVSSSLVSSCFAADKVSRKRDEELMAAKIAIFGWRDPGKNQPSFTGSKILEITKFGWLVRGDMVWICLGYFSCIFVSK